MAHSDGMHLTEFRNDILLYYLQSTLQQICSFNGNTTNALSVAKFPILLAVVVHL